MTVSELEQSVNWDLVGDEIEKHGLPSLDERSVLTNVVLAAKRWLPADLGKKLLSVEREYTRDGLKGIADLVILEEPDGSKTVIDWKTTGKVGPAWRRRHANAWQGPWYGYVAGPGVGRVIFRGIERSSGRSDEVEVITTAKVLLDMRFNADRTVDLRNESLLIPIRRGGYSCVAFDQECSYLAGRCEKTLVMSAQEYAYMTESPLSPSSAERIWNCPHQNTLYQLDKLRGNPVPDTGSDASNYGNAFHSGIAEVYRQMMSGPVAGGGE